MSDCVFCPENWGNLDIVDNQAYGIAIINPLRPVTDGHVLVISEMHTQDVAENPHVAADLMHRAAWWVKHQGIDANIITSIGSNATQTVRHTHLHIVPRRPGDGLALPWTGQQSDGDR